MYKNFFGFKEKPFTPAPNPKYLFMSKSHEKTLTHLLFAISHGEDFVGIIGEAGTGKTTLCRAFLDNLDESIEAAYIFDPKLDALQLLKAINREFGINSKPDNAKDLIDILNGFLIEKKAAGQKVLLLIDEAQNLSLEVLEQHHLFPNPETAQEKLLQIILIGRPELADMLSSHQLKQPGKRITKNCHLGPLTFMETIDYIRHHISLASHKTGPLFKAGPLFDKASCRVIYEYSRGIPRLINIACDMTLLHAFNRNSFKITGAIAREAMIELAREKPDTPQRKLKGMPGLAILSAVLVPLVIAVLYFTKIEPPETPVINDTALNTKVLSIAELNEPPVNKLEMPEKPLVISQSKPAEKIAEDTNVYSVHVGTFLTAPQANWRLRTLKSLGFPSFMYTSENKNGNTVYVVVAGQYKSYALAKEASQDLSDKGHYNFIAKAKDSLNKGPGDN